MVKKSRRSPGCEAFTGFMIGVCITFLIGLITIPQHIKQTRTVWVGREDRTEYIRELNLFKHQRKASNWKLPDSSLSNSDHVETEYIHTQSPLLCFMIEQISNDFIMINKSVNTWMRTCDRALVFYRTPYLPQRFNFSMRDGRHLVDFVSYPDPKLGLDLLISVLANYKAQIRWFAFVPHSVYLVPDNLQYYLTSSFINPKHMEVFFGKLEAGLTGDAISTKSPFVISLAAVLSAQLKTNILMEHPITDMKSLLKISGGNLYGLVNSQYQDVFRELQLGVIDKNPSHANAKDSIPVEYPASVYMGKNEFKFYSDMHYYIVKLQAYGQNFPFDRSTDLERLVAPTNPVTQHTNTTLRVTPVTPTLKPPVNGTNKTV